MIHESPLLPFKFVQGTAELNAPACFLFWKFCVFRMLLVIESVCLNCFNVLLHNKLCKWFKRTGDREELGCRGKEK